MGCGVLSVEQAGEEVRRKKTERNEIDEQRREGLRRGHGLGLLSSDFGRRRRRVKGD